MHSVIGVMPEVLIHTHLATLGNWRGRDDRMALLLWYYARAMDTEGSGNATIDLLHAAMILERSIVSIKRYLRKGKKGGLFRDYCLQGYFCTIWLTSRNKLAKALGLTSWGASVSIPLEELKNIRLYLIEGETKAATWASNHAAIVSSNRKLVERTAAVVKNSFYRSGLTGRLFFLFLNNTYISYGISQLRIGERLGVSERTINRNLANSYRIDRNVQPLSRVQICIYDPRYNAAYLGRDREAIASLKLIHPPGSSRAYRLYPAIYQSDLHLRSQRAARRKYKRSLSEDRRFSAVAGGEMDINKTYLPTEKEPPAAAAIL